MAMAGGNEGQWLAPIRDSLLMELEVMSGNGISIS
jgi:hypothetical protein